MRRHLGHGLILATLLVMTACGGDDDSPSASSTGDSTDVTTGLDGSLGGSGVTAPDSGAANSSTTTSLAASGSTTVAGSTVTTLAGAGTGTTVAGSGTVTTVAGAPVTTVAGTGVTTAPGPPPQTVADLVLRADGIGTLHFGTDVAAVIPSITAILGTPNNDSPAAYPIAVGDGTYKSQVPGEDGAPPEDDLGFIKPFGRTVCWSNGLCIESAGDTAGPYTFVGWYYAATDTNQLATADGLTVGSRWSDFPDVMTVQPGGCYSVGYGSSAGVSLNLQSDGTPFSSFDDAGNATEALPDPADVTVVQMEAGSQVTFLVGDC